jgi:nondiscriminating glutamyl-tRNA synthetase
MTKKIVNKSVRTRFAPSPTGELHIGGLRTALSNYLLAKQQGGSFILRIEDTDRKRLVEGAVERLLKSLQWSEVEPNEGVILGEDGRIVEKGECGPYTQSERLDIYKKYVDKLLVEGKAYYCFCSAERLDNLRKEQQKNKRAPKYDRHCLNLSPDEIQAKIKAGEKYVVRFKIPEGATTFQDEVFGKVSVKNETIDDQIILKSDGFPTYHLAVVVDDYLMKISHVFRGAEWLPSTPKHVLLYQALGWEKEMPKFVHMANILNKDKKKLSKREGSVSVNDFKKEGYPREALINFIALLGWNPKTEQEIFTMDELIQQFDIKKMNKAGGVFDLDRLAWISNQHIKRMSIDRLYKEGIGFLKKRNFYKTFLKRASFSGKELEEYLKRVLTVEQERLAKFTEIGVENKFFFQKADELQYDLKNIHWKDNSPEETVKTLEEIRELLENISETAWTRENIQDKLLELAGEKRGDYLFPLRWVLTGQQKSPSPFEVAWVLGKKESLERIKKGLEKF